MFFRAFYLDRGERRADEAVQLYRQFLEAAPNHKYAGRAARDAVALLSRAGKLDEAQKLRECSALIAAEPQAEPARRPRDGPARPRRPAESRPRIQPPEGGAERGAAGEPLSAEQKQRLEQRLGELKGRFDQIKDGGDAEEIARLERQIERLERQIKEGRAPAGREGRGPGGGGGSGDRMRVKFAEMSDDEITERLERSEQFQGQMLDRMRENGQGDRADEVEKQWAEMKKLLADGKKDEAQKIWDEVLGQMRRPRAGL